MPPDNSQYLVAAYIIAGCVYLAYTCSLFLRARNAAK